MLTGAAGIAAASGKFGAIIAQVAFERLKDIGGEKGEGKFIGHMCVSVFLTHCYDSSTYFLYRSLQIFAFFMLTGIFSTLLIPETKGRTLEDISNEDQGDFASAYASAHARARTGSVQGQAYPLGALANNSSQDGIGRPAYTVVQRNNGQPSQGVQQRTSGVQQTYNPYTDV